MLENAWNITLSMYYAVRDDDFRRLHIIHAVVEAANVKEHFEIN